MMGDTIPPAEPQVPQPARRPRARTLLAAGCFCALLMFCGVAGGLMYALRHGPVLLHLPGGNVLRMGSDSTVISNFSFQNGTTYFADLAGSGERSILELQVMPDSKLVELVIQHKTRESRQEQKLVSVRVP